MEITEILMLFNVKGMMNGYLYRNALISKKCVKCVKYGWKSSICLLIKYLNPNLGFVLLDIV